MWKHGVFHPTAPAPPKTTRRAEKTITDGQTETTTKYIYSGWQAIAEYDGSDTLLRKFVYGPGIDEPIAMVAVDGQDETWYYYHRNAFSSVVALSDPNSQIVEGYSYNVFGKCTVNTSAGTDGDWLTPDGNTATKSAE